MAATTDTAKAKEYAKDITTVLKARLIVATTATKLGAVASKISEDKKWTLFTSSVEAAALSRVENIISYAERIGDDLGKYGGNDEPVSSTDANRVGLLIVLTEKAASDSSKLFEDLGIGGFALEFIKSIKSILTDTIKQAATNLGDLGGDAVFSIVKGLWPLLLLAGAVLAVIIFVKVKS